MSPGSANGKNGTFPEMPLARCADFDKSKASKENFGQQFRQRASQIEDMDMDTDDEEFWKIAIGN